MPVNCCHKKLQDYDSLRRSSSEESMLCLAISNSKYSWGNSGRSH